MTRGVPRKIPKQYERDQALLDRYLQMARVSFGENPNLTVLEVVDKMAFLIVLAQSREKLARLLSMMLAEAAHSIHQENPWRPRTIDTTGCGIGGFQTSDMS